MTEFFDGLLDVISQVFSSFKDGFGLVYDTSIGFVGSILNFFHSLFNFLSRCISIIPNPFGQILVLFFILLTAIVVYKILRGD